MSHFTKLCQFALEKSSTAVTAKGFIEYTHKFINDALLSLSNCD